LLTNFIHPVNLIENTTVYTKPKLECFTLAALDLANSYTLSSAPVHGDSTLFDEPISEHVKSDTTEDLTYLDPEVTPLPSIPAKSFMYVYPLDNKQDIEFCADRLEPLNYVWKALKIFIARPFVTSQYDFTLPPLWSGNEPSGRKELFTVPYRPTPDSNEELERSYVEKFELEFIHFKGK
jgi:hypothetical protein